MVRKNKEEDQLTSDKVKGSKIKDNTEIFSSQENTKQENKKADTITETPNKIMSENSKTQHNVNNKKTTNRNNENYKSEESKNENKNKNNTSKDINNTNKIIRGEASLRKCTIAPRKVRILANMLRGKTLKRIFGILSCNQKVCCGVLKKLLFVALSNYEKNCEKNTTKSISEMEKLFLYKITVDNGGMLKRILPASQGRAFRIRKKFSHISVEIREC